MLTSVVDSYLILPLLSVLPMNAQMVLAVRETDPSKPAALPIFNFLRIVATFGRTDVPPRRRHGLCHTHGRPLHIGDERGDAAPPGPRHVWDTGDGSECAKVFFKLTENFTLNKSVH